MEYTSYWQYAVLSLCIVVQSPQRQHKDIASMPETLQIYKHTHKSISLYLLRFLSFFPEKTSEKHLHRKYFLHKTDEFFVKHF